MQARHYSQLYRHLRDVDPRDYQRIIRLYEEKEQEIGRLDVLENFELTVSYADALFATGAYRQHFMMVDLVIETCMRHNINRVEGIEGDVFHHLLFKKAASAFREQRYDVAVHVSRELIRMAPERELNVRFLRACLFRLQAPTLQYGRAIFICCLLVSAALILLEILLWQTTYPDFVPLSQTAIGVCFATGILSLMGFYGYAYSRAHTEAYGFQRRAKNK
ncbi:hypothetical protein [Lewinella sp. 4G2]|uniref:hypothetical protein n=1 Tax=Lewinella sp. 4G2 TaxID=1803372 RepID=UPI0007B46CA9|nr:hypothetical protein [Lewinella sp. 4G2]OAV43875.1 hypothetical protein A3850_004900 [Lewinella sp. 4G2]